MKRMIPDFAWHLVARYGLTPRAGERLQTPQETT